VGVLRERAFDWVSEHREDAGVRNMVGNVAGSRGRSQITGAALDRQPTPSGLAEQRDVIGVGFDGAAAEGRRPGPSSQAHRSPVLAAAFAFITESKLLARTSSEKKCGSLMGLI
jgi:hypothetical protein